MTRVRTKVAWAGVPQGTTGTLAERVEEGRGVYYSVTWDKLSPYDGEKPYVDAFTKKEVDTYLEILK